MGKFLSKCILKKSGDIRKLKTGQAVVLEPERGGGDPGPVLKMKCDWSDITTFPPTGKTGRPLKSCLVLTRPKNMPRKRVSWRIPEVVHGPFEGHGVRKNGQRPVTDLAAEKSQKVLPSSLILERRPTNQPKKSVRWLLPDEKIAKDSDGDIFWRNCRRGNGSVERNENLRDFRRGSTGLTGPARKTSKSTGSQKEPRGGGRDRYSDVNRGGYPSSGDHHRSSGYPYYRSSPNFKRYAEEWDATTHPRL